MDTNDMQVNVRIMEQELDDLFIALGNRKPGSEEYDDILKQIDKLTKVKRAEFEAIEKSEERKRKAKDARRERAYERNLAERERQERRRDKRHDQKREDLHRKREAEAKRREDILRYVPVAIGVALNAGLAFMIYKGEMQGELVNPGAQNLLRKMF